MDRLIRAKYSAFASFKVANFQTLPFGRLAGGQVEAHLDGEGNPRDSFVFRDGNEWWRSAAFWPGRLQRKAGASESGRGQLEITESLVPTDDAFLNAAQIQTL